MLNQRDHEKEVAKITEKFNQKSAHLAPNYFKAEKHTPQEIQDQKALNKLREQFNVEIENINAPSDGGVYKSLFKR